MTGPIRFSENSIQINLNSLVSGTGTNKIAAGLTIFSCFAFYSMGPSSPLNFELFFRGG